MTIETNLERIANALENISAAFARIDMSKQQTTPIPISKEATVKMLESIAKIPAVEEKQKVTEAANEPAAKLEYSDLVKKAQLLQARKGKEAVKAVLAELKVKSMQDLKEDRYVECLTVIARTLETEAAA